MKVNWARVFYQIRNWRAWLRAAVLGTSHTVENALFRMFGVTVGGRTTFRGELSIIHFGPSGEVIADLGVVSRRVVTTAGCTMMASDFNGGGATTDITLFNFHDSGTGNTAEAIGDTDLITPAGPATRATGTKSNPTAATYQSVGTITYTTGTPLAIVEHGLFNQAARGAGTVLWDRSVFSVVNVASGESIQFTYTLTVTAGG